jgi:TRAP-type C4-dicarboxylate transport system permease small subunit
MSGISWSPMCILMVAMVSFFGGSMLVKTKSKLFQRYTANLNSEQRLRYIETIRERSNIFLTGIFIGLLTSGIILTRNRRHDQTNRLCLVVGVTLATACVYYLLSPKKHYMLRELTTRTQINDWLDIYRAFRNYTYWSMLVGVLVYGLVAYTV